MGNPVKVLVDHNDGQPDHIIAEMVGWSNDGLYAIVNITDSVNIHDPNGATLTSRTIAVESHLVQDAPYFVNVYEVSRSYGGPEEGGWWYTCGTVIESRFVGVGHNGLVTAENLVDQLRSVYPDNGTYTSVVYSGGDYRMEISNRPGENFPTERPYYE